VFPRSLKPASDFRRKSDPSDPSDTPNPPNVITDGSRLRTLHIGSRLLSYRLKRSSRRTIGFVVNRTGLTITAPNRLSLSAIETAIGEKQRWIFTKLEEWLDLAETPAQAPIEWVDGVQFPLYGEPATLRLLTPADGAKRVRARLDYDPLARILTLVLPEGTEAAQIGTLLRHWLRSEARRWFAERLSIHAPIVGVRYTAFALSSATTRWGSCSSSGAIRLNWRLIHFPLDVIDYVVIHELAHLREMNHSPRFWAVVESVMPSYRLARETLKRPAPGTLPNI
jgi:predicted metal-dependent hydrolase